MIFLHSFNTLFSELWPNLECHNSDYNYRRFLKDSAKKCTVPDQSQAVFKFPKSSPFGPWIWSRFCSAEMKVSCLDMWQVCFTHPNSFAYIEPRLGKNKWLFIWRQELFLLFIQYSVRYTQVSVLLKYYWVFHKGKDRKGRGHGDKQRTMQRSTVVQHRGQCHLAWYHPVQVKSYHVTIPPKFF